MWRVWKELVDEFTERFLLKGAGSEFADMLNERGKEGVSGEMGETIFPDRGQ